VPGVVAPPTGRGRKKTTSIDGHWRSEIDDHVAALAWSPDGRTLAAAAVGGPITLFDRETGAIRHRLPGHGFGTAALSWSAGGQLLASAGQDGRARIWDAATGQERLSLDAGAAWVERVAWCPVAPLLATAAGRKLRLWDADGNLLRAYPDHPSTIADLAWKPRSQEITTAAYGGLALWSTEQNEPLRRLKWQGSTLTIAWSPDRTYIATGDQDSTVHFWVARSGNDYQMYGYPRKVRELAWDAGSRYLATGGSPTVVVWDCSGRGPQGTTPLMLEAHKEPLTALAFERGGGLLASGGADGALFLWHPGRFKTALTGVAYHAPVAQLAWSPDDRLLAVGTAAGSVDVLTVRR